MEDKKDTVKGKTRNGQQVGSGKRGLKSCKIYRTEQTEAHLKRARDQVTKETQCEQPDKSGGKRQRFDYEDRLPDITEFCISKE